MVGYTDDGAYPHKSTGIVEYQLEFECLTKATDHAKCHLLLILDQLEAGRADVLPERPLEHLYGADTRRQRVQPRNVLDAVKVHEGRKAAFKYSWEVLRHELLLNNLREDGIVIHD